YDDRQAVEREALEDAEIDDHDRADEDPEETEELELRLEVGLAGLVDQLADFEHGLMDREVAQLAVYPQAEAEAGRADQEADHQQRLAGLAEEGGDRGVVQGRDDEVGFAAAGLLRPRGH